MQILQKIFLYVTTHTQGSGVNTEIEYGTFFNTLEICTSVNYTYK